MHRALDVDDILHEIFTHLATPSNPENPVPPGAELLQAALSCRRFRVHALKPLYDDLPSIKPLLRLLGTEDELQREEVIPHDRWIKFAEYSCWVSSVDIFLEDFPTQIFPQVYCLLGGRPLLPSLQHLTLRLPRWHATPRVVIMSLAAPTIRSLHILVPRPAAEALRMDSGEDITLITAKQQDSIIDTLLSTIAYASPTGLECIRIVGSRPRSRITSCISQFSSLRVLDIPSRMDLGTEAVALSLTAETMGQLTMLCVPAQLVSNLSPHVILKSLRKLALSGPFSLVLEVLSRASAPQLETITLKCSAPGRNVLTSVLSQGLTFNFCNLHYFSILLGGTRTDPKLREILTPLSSLLSVRNVHVDYYGSVPVEDDDLTSIASRMPKVRDLRFEHWPGTGNHPLNLTGLRMLAQHCPDLETLALPVYAAFHLFQMPPPFTHGLRALEFLGGSEPGLPANTVAAYLDRTFPSLDPKQCTFSDCRDLRYWKEIVQSLVDLRTSPGNGESAMASTST